MEKYITDERTGLKYELVGDYYLLAGDNEPEEEQKPIGMWGQRHLRYLKNHRKVHYANLLTSGKLNNYLSDIDRQAEEMFERLTELEIPVDPYDAASDRQHARLQEADILIDAVFGTGFSGVLPESLQELFAFLRSCKGYVVSIDLPSGLSADTNLVESGAVYARACFKLQVGSLCAACAGSVAERKRNADERTFGGERELAVSDQEEFNGRVGEKGTRRA